jgi:hypothetical protein
VIGWPALGGNPVPGDPLAIRASAARQHSIADKVSQQSRLVQSVAGDGTSSWRGPAATAFRALSNDLDLVHTALVGAHRQAADALSTFAAVLANLQSQAEQLAGQANQAAREYANAHQQVTLLAPQVTAAQTAYNQAAAVPPGSNPNLVGPVADPALSSAYQAMTSKQAQTGSAQQAASQASATLDSCRSHAFALHAQANAAAERCAATLHSVSDWPKIEASLGALNDRAGWVLNAWGVYGGVVTSDKLFDLLTAQRVFQAAKRAESAAFQAWNKQDGGPLAWDAARKSENTAWKRVQDAKSEVEDEIAPAATDGEATKLIGRAGLVLAMASDVVTLVDPSPSFGSGHVLGGWRDRGMAFANFAASGIALGDSFGLVAADAAISLIPGGVVVASVLVGTAAYFASEFVYQHWGDITGAVSTATHWAGQEASEVGGDIGHDVSDAFGWL